MTIDQIKQNTAWLMRQIESDPALASVILKAAEVDLTEEEHCPSVGDAEPRISSREGRHTYDCC